MKYFAPITDYVPKSTFVVEEFIPVIQAVQPWDLKGYLVSIAGDKVYFWFHTKSSYFSIGSIYLVCVGAANLTAMKISGTVLWGEAGNSYNVHLDMIADEPIGNTITDKLVYFNMASLLPTFSTDQSVYIVLSRSAVAPATNVYIRGLVINYNLA